MSRMSVRPQRVPGSRLTGVQQALFTVGIRSWPASDCILKDVDMTADVNPLCRVREEFRRQKKRQACFPAPSQTGCKRQCSLDDHPHFFSLTRIARTAARRAASTTDTPMNTCSCSNCRKKSLLPSPVVLIITSWRVDAPERGSVPTSMNSPGGKLTVLTDVLYVQVCSVSQGSV